MDPKKVSVSGLSAGAFMAVQMHVAYSKTFMGAGIIAGGEEDNDFIVEIMPYYKFLALFNLTLYQRQEVIGLRNDQVASFGFILNSSPHCPYLCAMAK